MAIHPAPRFLFLAGAALALAVGIWAGLGRLGGVIPPLAPDSRPRQRLADVGDLDPAITPLRLATDALDCLRCGFEDAEGDVGGDALSLRKVSTCGTAARGVRGSAPGRESG